MSRSKRTTSRNRYRRLSSKSAFHPLCSVNCSVNARGKGARTCRRLSQGIHSKSGHQSFGAGGQCSCSFSRAVYSTGESDVQYRQGLSQEFRHAGQSILGNIEIHVEEHNARTADQVKPVLIHALRTELVALIAAGSPHRRSLTDRATADGERCRPPPPFSFCERGQNVRVHSIHVCIVERHMAPESAISRRDDGTLSSSFGGRARRTN